MSSDKVLSPQVPLVCLLLVWLSFVPEVYSAEMGKNPASWSVPAAQGTIMRGQDGKSIQVRFPSWPVDDFSAYSTHSYTNKVKASNVIHAAPPKSKKGNPRLGGVVWLKAACVNCHALPGAPIKDDRWAGNVGPSLAAYGARRIDPARTYQVIYDPRSYNPHTIMPAWGTAGILSAEDIWHLVAFLNSLKSTSNKDSNETQNPASRPVPVAYFGDNLDPTRNPAALLAERGETLWNKVGPKQQSCVSCHGANVEQAMKGKATAYPQYIVKYQRVVSIEDLLAVHAEETTGVRLPVESDDNLQLATLIKMQSNGLPISIDLSNDKNRAAWERGRGTFYSRIGQRNHSCADCHAPEYAKDKWLGGRFIGRADASLGLTATYPAWRTSFGQIWGLRRRFQWCMLPHGANNLAADAVEYADMELYLAAFANGKKLNVPGLKD